MKGKTSSSLLSNRKFGAKVRINERNAKGKLKFFFSFPSESTFGVAKVRISERKTKLSFPPFPLSQKTIFPLFFSGAEKRGKRDIHPYQASPYMGRM